MNIIDYLVFEYVFENEKGYVEYLKENNCAGSIVRDYSTDVKYALEVADKMNLTITPRWRVFRANTAGSMRDIKYIGTTNNQSWTEHRSLPMAICLAALKLLGIDSLEDEAEGIVSENENIVKRNIEELEKRLGRKL